MGLFFFLTIHSLCILLYIIYSQKIDKFYIGYTATSIQQRIYRHNNQHFGFTGRANDWTIQYSESFKLKDDAIKREKQIKAWKSRKMIEQLIQNAQADEDSF